MTYFFSLRQSWTKVNVTATKNGIVLNIEFVTESPLSKSDKSNRKHVEKISVNHMNIKKKESKLDKKTRPLEVKSKTNTPLKTSINDVREDGQ